MTSPYISLTKAAITAKLKQNEGLIFHALMMQTLGFRKTIDNLTDKRLAQLTGIRLDHLRPALDSFLGHNLFYRIEHRDYDYQYRICDEFLDDAQSTVVYPPTLPKTGEARDSWEDFPDVGEDSPQTLGEATEVGVYSPPTSGKLTELGGHTTENPYIKKPQPLKPSLLEKQQPQTNTKKTDFIKKQPQPKTEKTDFIEQQQQPFVTTISMIGLENMPKQFVIESSGSVRFEFSAQSSAETTEEIMQPTETVAKSVTEMITEPTELSIVEPTIESIVEPIIEPTIEPIAETNSVEKNKEPIVKPIATPISKSVTKAVQSTTAKTVGELVTAIVPELNQMTQTINEETTKTVVVVDEKEEKKKPLAIPKAVGEVNIKACNNHFVTLSEQQQKDVLIVFYHMLKIGKIRNKANYFISLAQSAKDGSLTVPTEAIVAAQSQTPTAIAKRKAAAKEQEERATHWSNYCWIKEQAVLQDKSEEALAQLMGFEDAYAVFGGQPALAA
jgi:hypothetical protein